MKSLVESLNDSLINEGLLDKIKSLFKKQKKETKSKQVSAKEMIDELGIHELDDISEDDLVKIAKVYQKTLGMKYDLEKPHGCLAFMQGLYDGAYTNGDDSKNDEFGEKRLDHHLYELAADKDAGDLVVNRSGYDELGPGIKIDYIHGYVYAFGFAGEVGLTYSKKKTFKYEDGIELKKKLK